MKYESRHVLFCDILGFTHAVKSKDINVSGIFSILQNLQNYIDSANVLNFHPSGRYSSREEQGYRIRPIAEHFSDCVVVSVEATNLGAIWLCEVASQLQGIIVQQGFLCRGAITTGEMCHRESTIFGPAYIEAVELEKETAFPRIALSDNILEWFLSSEDETNYQIARIRESQLVAIDNDSTRRVDPFSQIKLYATSDQIPEHIKQLIRSWDSTIKSGIKHPDQKTRGKYEWAASEYEKLMKGENLASLPFNGYPSLMESII
ncbi:MAG: hypothetical protein JJV99_08605 [Colwellia sp.]|nr:hypothetical protein [Colwellia sp.]